MTNAPSSTSAPKQAPTGQAPSKQAPSKQADAQTTRLARTVSLPMLIFYGLGVTVGAGIFALVGEILESSGGLAPVSFIVAGAIAGATALTYSYFVPRFPRAGGEAVYVSAGLGDRAGAVVGALVIVAGTVSSSVVALAFGGYLSDTIGIAPRLGAVAVVVVAAAVACRGVRESVVTAAVITLIEVGALVVVIAFGLPEVLSGDVVGAITESPESGGRIGAVAAGAILAFFAFIGFEDIANLAEETKDPERNGPKAIYWTLGVSILLYVLISVIAITLPQRQAIIDSDAPMARVFELVSGLDGRPLSVIASLAMTNGILIQLVMASRVAFGMIADGLAGDALKPLAAVHPRWKTPVRATVAVAGAIMLLVATAPLEALARWTSVIILTIFALVNASLLRLVATGTPAPALVRRSAAAGLVASTVLACWEIASTMIG